ncbi:hypothetical protein GF389_01975 [Candidatus Dojkabacteria bacterium]|nr:hypothetical protein [Candidatus Dojkabacteria bacterium]
MINISKIVKEIIEDDPVALDAMSNGYMNYSSYARLIQPMIEKDLLQKVSEKSITVALSRIGKSLPKKQKREAPRILNLSLHVDLAEISYEKTYDNVEKLNKIKELSPKDPKDFFASTSGVSEITLIGKSALIEEIEKEIMDVESSYSHSDLSGISIKFPQEQLNVPGILVQLVNQVSKKGINLIEVISTNTELTLLVDKKDAEATIAQLSKLL